MTLCAPGIVSGSASENCGRRGGKSSEAVNLFFDDLKDFLTLNSIKALLTLSIFDFAWMSLRLHISIENRLHGGLSVGSLPSRVAG